MDGDYDPTQDDDVASDHLDDDAPGPSKRKTAGAVGGKDDVGLGWVSVLDLAVTATHGRDGSGMARLIIIGRESSLGRGV